MPPASQRAVFRLASILVITSFLLYGAAFFLPSSARPARQDSRARPTRPYETRRVGPAGPAAASAARRSPLTPELSLKEFRLAPGLRIELVASESDLESPVAIAFD